jgi:MFS family permease
MAAGPFVLSTLSALSPLVVDEFDLSSTEYGAIATVGFIAGALFSSVFGRWFDRHSDRRLMLTVCVSSGGAILVLGTAQGYAWLMLAMLVAGAAQGLSTPVTNRIVALRLARRRALATGIKQSGVQLSQLLAGLSLPLLAPLIGWRGAMTVAATTALVGALMVAVLVPSSRQTVATARTRTSREPLPPLVWWMTAYSTTMGAGLQAFNVHIPLYAHSELGFDVQAAGLTTAVAGCVGVASRVLWSRVSDSIVSPARVLGLVACLSVCSAGLVVVSAVAKAPAVLWIACAIYGASGLASNAIAVLVLVRVVSFKALARGTAISMVGLFSGFAMGPVLFGVLADAFGYPTAMSVVVGIFALASVLMFTWSRTGRYELVREKLRTAVTSPSPAPVPDA